MREELLQKYQDLFSVQIADMETIDEIVRQSQNLAPSTWSNKKTLINILQSIIENRSKELILLDEFIVSLFWNEIEKSETATVKEYHNLTT